MKLSMLLGFFCFITICINAQPCIEKDINSIKLFPPYSDCEIQNLAEVINNGSEVFILLPVKDRKHGNGYLLKSSRFIEKYWDMEEVKKELQKLPYNIDSIRHELYDFGIIRDFNLVRFKKFSDCELLNLYFDSDGNVKQLGSLSPISYVIAELTLRNIKVFLNWDGIFIVDKEFYCP